MSARKALLMALILAAGLAFVWVQERRPEGDVPVAEGNELILKGFLPETVNKLHLISASSSSSFGVFRETATNTESAGQAEWLLREPFGAPAKTENVTALLRALAELEAKNIVPAEEVAQDQSAYGLLPPALIIRLEGSFGEAVLSFGRSHTVTGRRFVQVEGEPRIFLIEEEDFESVNRSYNDVRSLKPLQFDPDSVSSVLVIQGERDPLLFERLSEDAGKWLLKDPRVVQPADASLIMKELRALAEVEVLRFLPPGQAPLETYGLNQPSLILHLRFDKPITSAAPGYSDKELILHFAEGPQLTVVDSEDELRTLGLFFFRVAGQQWIYELDQPFYRGWLQPAWHFFLKRPYSQLSAEEVREIRISAREAGTVRLERADSEEQWRVNFDEGRTSPATLNHDIIGPWMENLFRLRVLSYLSVELPDSSAQISLDEHGLNAPWLEVELRGENGQIIYLSLGESLDGEAESKFAPRYALLEGVGVMKSLVVLSAAEVEALTPSPELFRREVNQQSPETSAGLQTEE